MLNKKNRIRLHRNLQVHTTPYPEAKLWLKRTVFLLSLIVILGTVFLARNEKNSESSIQPAKEILGEQEKTPETEEFDIYTIKKGDTLFNLSQRYGIPWQRLAEYNSLAEPYTLRIGEKVKIPTD